MGKGNKQYYEFSNYIEETNNEHDSKNKIKIFLLFISKCISTKDITWFKNSKKNRRKKKKNYPN